MNYRDRLKTLEADKVQLTSKVAAQEDELRYLRLGSGPNLERLNAQIATLQDKMGMFEKQAKARRSLNVTVDVPSGIHTSRP